MNVTGICNLALSHIGFRQISSIDPPDGTREAEICAQFYPLARNYAIQKIKPVFARKIDTLTDTSLTVLLLPGWRFAYSMPEQCLHFVGVFDPAQYLDEDAEPAAAVLNTEGTQVVILTNMENAVGKWLTAETSNDHYTPDFCIALSWVLASFISGSLIKGKAGVETAKAALQNALGYITDTKVDDANQGSVSHIRDDTRHRAPWLDARGIDPYEWPAAKVLNDGS